jgi:hypothetical protein
MREIPPSFRRMSTEKGGPAASSRAAIWMRSMTRLASTTRPAALIAAKRAASSGAVPDRITCSPSTPVSAQSCPASTSEVATSCRDCVSIAETEATATPKHAAPPRRTASVTGR